MAAAVNPSRLAGGESAERRPFGRLPVGGRPICAKMHGSVLRAMSWGGAVTAKPMGLPPGRATRALGVAGVSGILCEGSDFT